LFITCNKLFKDTYINYNAIEFLRSITLYYDIYKRVLFIVYNVCNKSGECVYK